MSLKHLRPQLESVPLFHLQGADSQRGLVTDDKAREPSLGLVSCVLVRWTPLHRVPHRLCHKSTQPPAPALWEPSWKPTKAGDSQCGPPPDSEDPRCGPSSPPTEAGWFCSGVDFYFPSADVLIKKYFN